MQQGVHKHFFVEPVHVVAGYKWAPANGGKKGGINTESKKK